MTSIERTAYPRFKRYYTEKEIREIYTPTQSEKAFSRSHTAGQKNYLNLIISLKTFVTAHRNKTVLLRKG